MGIDSGRVYGEHILMEPLESSLDGTLEYCWGYLGELSVTLEKGPLGSSGACWSIQCTQTIRRAYR